MPMDGLVTAAVLLVAATVNVPDPIGIPDRMPVTGSRVSPDGRVPEATANVGAG